MLRVGVALLVALPLNVQSDEEKAREESAKKNLRRPTGDRRRLKDKVRRTARKAAVVTSNDTSCVGSCERTVEASVTDVNSTGDMESGDKAFTVRQPLTRGAGAKALTATNMKHKATMRVESVIFLCVRTRASFWRQWEPTQKKTRA